MIKGLLIFMRNEQIDSSIDFVFENNIWRKFREIATFRRL